MSPSMKREAAPARRRRPPRARRRGCAGGRWRSCRGRRPLAELEQRLDQMRADEAGAAGHEPARGASRSVALHVGSCRGRRRRRCIRDASTVDAALRAALRRRTGTSRRRSRPPGSSLATIVVDRPRVELAVRDRERRSRRARGSSSHGVERRRRTRAALRRRRPPDRARARRRRTTRSSRMTSITRELRRSGQFSLKVRPSTLTFAPLTGKPALDHLLDRLLGDVLAHAVVDAPARRGSPAGGSRAARALCVR